ncbi:hypothetical protein DVH24_013864 [Malus domestica]|uniref:Uncharacterized protein n=1 Tax=Malus domestica TaxID=3750 RepID=A0A498JC27_MALDO|nr:hypothetical protein DVH24_013864 [Malus domestica]
MSEMQVFNETEANNPNIIKGIPCLVGITKWTVSLVGIDDGVAGRGFHEGVLCEAPLSSRSRIDWGSHSDVSGEGTGPDGMADRVKNQEGRGSAQQRGRLRDRSGLAGSETERVEFAERGMNIFNITTDLINILVDCVSKERSMTLKLEREVRIDHN